MIDLQKYMILAMKGQMYPGKDALNSSARHVIGEMKTKYVDIKEEITNEIQFKMLQKMKKDRENSISVYSEAYKKSGSNVAKDNLESAQNELETIALFLLELEAEMPKKMSESETEKFIKELISKFPNKPNIGLIMKLIKANPIKANLIDMALASKIIKKYI